MYIGGKTLTPVARVCSFGRARGTFGTHRLGGWAGAFARIRPVAVIVETDDGEQRVAIRDATRRAVWMVYGLGVALTLVLVIVRWLAHQRSGNRR